MKNTRTTIELDKREEYTPNHKLLYFDVETTGIDLSTHHVFQISGLIEINGTVVKEFNLFTRPPKGSSVSKMALQVTGKTIEDLRSYEDAFTTHKELTRILGMHVNKMDFMDKFTPVAYNGHFDIQFLNKFFKETNNDPYFGSWQNWQLLDPLAISRWMIHTGRLPELPNHKLETLCNYFNIQINAHDALSDIRATRELLIKLKEL